MGQNDNRDWHKSTASGADGCVEARQDEDGMQVRNSRDPCVPVLTFTGDEWKAFLIGVRRHEFDLD
jgi:hypothetical protein